MKTSAAALLAALCAALVITGLACSSKDHPSPLSGCDSPACAQGIGGGGYSSSFPDSSADGETDGATDGPATDSGSPAFDASTDGSSGGDAPTRGD